MTGFAPTFWDRLFRAKQLEKRVLDEHSHRVRRFTDAVKDCRPEIKIDEPLEATIHELRRAIGRSRRQ